MATSGKPTVVKLRELLRKMVRPLSPDAQRAADDVETAMTVGGTAPPKWVPSQQDERPRH
jgi:hypothetical protein